MRNRHLRSLLVRVCQVVARACTAAWRWRWVRFVLCGAGVLVLGWLVVVAAPPWFVDDESLEGLRAQNEVRGTLLQGGAGLILLAGAYFTWRQLHTAREGQITERYTRAIDQLGHPAMDVRLGGIYALERIARDSPTDRATISEVLAAFIRTHAPWPPTLPSQPDADAHIDKVPAMQRRHADVQASLTVLGRGGFAPRRFPGAPEVDLSAADLRKADLKHAHLKRANLSHAHLEGAYLSHAHLQGADLDAAHLEKAYLLHAHLEDASLFGTRLKCANLFEAHLEEATLNRAQLRWAKLNGAHLEEAHVEKAYLIGAHLKGAHLTGAHLEKAYLIGANLEKAYLTGAHLEGANLFKAHLEGANLRGATADEDTTWPHGFDWRRAGVTAAGA